MLPRILRNKWKRLGFVLLFFHDSFIYLCCLNNAVCAFDVHTHTRINIKDKLTDSLMLQVSSPLLILHGAADKVTDPLVSQFLYQKASSKDKTLKLYEGAYHSILEGEPDTKIFAVFDDIIAWLDSRCSAK